MNKLTKAIAIAAVLGASSLTATSASAWWGGNPFFGNGNGYGDGDFSFSMRGNARGNGYGYNNPYYGYAPYGYAPYGAAPYGAAPYGAPYGAPVAVAPQAPQAETQ